MERKLFHTIPLHYRRWKPGSSSLRFGRRCEIHVARFRHVSLLLFLQLETVAKHQTWRSRWRGSWCRGLIIERPGTWGRRRPINKLIFHKWSGWNPGCNVVSSHIHWILSRRTWIMFAFLREGSHFRCDLFHQPVFPRFGRHPTIQPAQFRAVVTKVLMLNKLHCLACPCIRTGIRSQSLKSKKISLLSQTQPERTD